MLDEQRENIAASMTEVADDKTGTHESKKDLVLTRNGRERWDTDYPW